MSTPLLSPMRLRLPQLLLAVVLLLLSSAVSPVVGGCVGGDDIFCGYDDSGEDAHTCGGSYECRASPGSFDCSCQLAGGIIAAIVISCIVGTGLIITAIVCIVRRRRRAANAAAQAIRDEQQLRLQAERVARGEPPGGWPMGPVGSPVMMYPGAMGVGGVQQAWAQPVYQQPYGAVQQPGVYAQMPYAPYAQQPLYGAQAWAVPPQQPMQIHQQQQQQPQQPQQPLQPQQEGYTPGQHMLSYGAPQPAPASAPAGAPGGAPAAAGSSNCTGCGKLLPPYDGAEAAFCPTCGTRRNAASPLQPGAPANDAPPPYQSVGYGAAGAAAPINQSDLFRSGKVL